MDREGTICVILITLAGICILPTGANMRCYSCDKVAHGSDCASVSTCGSHQQCYTRRKVGPALDEYYESGCVDKATCRNQYTWFQSLFGSPPIGKRQSVKGPQSKHSKRVVEPIVTCFECCDGDYCNSALCGAAPPKRRRCFNCNDVTDPHNCDSITECDLDEMCFVKFAPKEPTHEYRYNLGCRGAIQCNALMAVYDMDTCIRCCNQTDYCNWRACDDWKYTKGPVIATTPKLSATTPTSTVPTTPMPTTTTPTTPAPPPKPLIQGTKHASYTHSALLVCSVPDPTIPLTWYYHSRGALPDGVTQIPGNMLRIAALNESNAGAYTCVSTAPSGHTASSHVRVSIDDTPPAIVSLTKDPQLLPSPGDKIELTCVALGYPLPTYSWQYFDTNGGHTVPSTVVYSAKKDVLTIEHYANVVHDGQWRCTATNPIGHSQKVVPVP